MAAVMELQREAWCILDGKEKKVEDNKGRASLLFYGWGGTRQSLAIIGKVQPKREKRAIWSSAMIWMIIPTTQGGRASFCILAGPGLALLSMMDGCLITPRVNYMGPD